WRDSRSSIETPPDVFQLDLGLTPANDTTQNAAVRAYLDCSGSGCDREFLVTEMTWVNWMRERLDADFHVLVTSQATGSGGREYVAVAIGQRAFAGRSDTLTFTSNPNDATDTIRRSLLRVLGQLLLPHAARGSLGPRLNVTFAAPATGRAAAPAAAKDKWNFWTFSVSGNGFLNGESRQTFTNVSSNLSANRTTEQWKVRLSSSVSYSESEFKLESGDAFVSIQRNSGASGLVVKSAGDHWSYGGRATLTRSDFSNTNLATQVGAAAEWDYFPYKDFARRKIAVLYTVGAVATTYNALTIYDRLNETRPLHTLNLTYAARQPWGSANVTISGSQYLNELKYYNAGINGGLDFRLGRGLSFNVNGSLSRVRDQLFLPRGSRSNEEVIARQQALATNYRYVTFFGLRYQFGSIFNSVVNPRFGNISGHGGGEFISF
ncbi:MAG: hypothetical protein O2973_10425, partial [Gemmatimonadetes bacterium]|nr:hypothetical protein [Gemmatimonadota bacterium]